MICFVSGCGVEYFSICIIVISLKVLIDFDEDWGLFVFYVFKQWFRGIGILLFCYLECDVDRCEYVDIFLMNFYVVKCEYCNLNRLYCELICIK